MFCVRAILCLLLNLALIAALSNENSDDVIFVSVIYRHGDRTPIEPYPTDPYRNNSLWPVGWGELTDIGKRGHYELGKWLRKRYSYLLPQKYTREEIHVQSTNVDRTLMSAYSNLAGLYEPDLSLNWNPNIKWQPIPVHTTPEHLDEVLAAKKPCPKYDAYVAALKLSDEFRKIDLENTELYKYLNEHTGLKIKEVRQLGDLYNTLFIETLYNFTLPAWTDAVYPQPLKKWAEFGFTLPCYDRKMARLKVGPLISDIATHMKKKINGKLNPDRKVWVYSAHDITVANILQALGVFDPQCPPYRSTVLIELQKKNGNHFVAIYYKNSSTENPMLMKIPGCEELCPFEKFSNLISPLVPIDWERECQYAAITENIYDLVTGSSFLLSVVLMTSFLILFAISIRFYKRQNHVENDVVYQSLKMEINS